MKRIIYSVLILVMLLSMCCTCTFVSADTTVIEDFEDASTLNRWSYIYGSDNYVTYAFSTDVVHGGTNSLRVQKTTKGSSYGVKYNVLPEIQKNGAGMYVLSLYYYLNTADATISVRPQMNVNGTTIYPRTNSGDYAGGINTESGRWVYTEFVYDLSDYSNCTSAYIMFHTKDDDRVYDMYFDDISFVKTNDIIMNGNMEVDTNWDKTNVTISYDTSVVHSGSRSIKVVESGTTYTNGLKQNFKISIKNTGAGLYELTAYIRKSAETTSTLMIRPTIIVGSLEFFPLTNGTPQAGKTISTDWTEVKYMFDLSTVTDFGEYPSLVFRQFNGSTWTPYTPIPYTIWVDDVSLLPVEPILESTTPRNGVTLADPSTTTVTFTYDMDIASDSLSDITVNGAPATATVSGGVITVDFEKEYNTTYTVSIPSTVKSTYGNAVKPATLTFKTKKDKDLITNGDFETGSYIANFEANDTTVAIEKDAHTGDYYAKMTRAASSNYWSSMRPLSDQLVKKYNEYGAGTYKYSALYKSDSATGTYILSPIVTVRFSDGTSITPTADVSVNADGWASFELEFEIPSDKAVSGIYIGQYTPIDKTKDYVLYIDDMELVKIAEPKVEPFTITLENNKAKVVLDTTSLGGELTNDSVIIIASYNSDDSLEKFEIIKKANATITDDIWIYTTTNDMNNSAYIKAFCWSNLADITPLCVHGQYSESYN